MPESVGTWSINANGSQGHLQVEAVDGEGNLTGSVFGQPITGFWDDVAKSITFVRIASIGDASANQIYTGYLIDKPSTVLVGSFQAFKGTGGATRRALFGWFAEKSD